DTQTLSLHDALPISPGVHVPVRPGLVDRRGRAQPHGHGGELPEVVHVVRVRVGGQAAAAGRARELLAEPVQVVLAQAALQVGAGIHAGGGVPLEVDLVPAAGVVLAAEEVVQAHFVQGGHRSVGGNVPAH